LEGVSAEVLEPALEPVAVEDVDTASVRPEYVISAVEVAEVLVADPVL
jgi:hypothetical protein